jgi:hypothetical protein
VTLGEESLTAATAGIIIFSCVTKFTVVPGEIGDNALKLDKLNTSSLLKNIFEESSYATLIQSSSPGRTKDSSRRRSGF